MAQKMRQIVLGHPVHYQFWWCRIWYLCLCSLVKIDWFKTVLSTFFPYTRNYGSRKVWIWNSINLVQHNLSVLRSSFQYFYRLRHWKWRFILKSMNNYIVLKNKADCKTVIYSIQQSYTTYIRNSRYWSEAGSNRPDLFSNKASKLRK